MPVVDEIEPYQVCRTKRIELMKMLTTANVKISEVCKTS
jgi:hypothetical protein